MISHSWIVIYHIVLLIANIFCISSNVASNSSSIENQKLNQRNRNAGQLSTVFTRPSLNNNPKSEYNVSRNYSVAPFNSQRLSGKISNFPTTKILNQTPTKNMLPSAALFVLPKVNHSNNTVTNVTKRVHGPYFYSRYNPDDDDAVDQPYGETQRIFKSFSPTLHILAAAPTTQSDNGIPQEDDRSSNGDLIVDNDESVNSTNDDQPDDDDDDDESGHEVMNEVDRAMEADESQDDDNQDKNDVSDNDYYN